VSKIDHHQFAKWLLLIAICEPTQKIQLPPATSWFKCFAGDGSSNFTVNLGITACSLCEVPHVNPFCRRSIFCSHKVQSQSFSCQLVFYTSAMFGQQQSILIISCSIRARQRCTWNSALPSCIMLQIPLDPGCPSFSSPLVSVTVIKWAWIRPSIIK
jgi:hypothetical protein